MSTSRPRSLIQLAPWIASTLKESLPTKSARAPGRAPPPRCNGLPHPRRASGDRAGTPPRGGGACRRASGCRAPCDSRRDRLRAFGHRLRSLPTAGVVRLETGTEKLLPDPRCAVGSEDRALQHIALGGVASARSIADGLGVSLRSAQQALESLVREGLCGRERHGVLPRRGHHLPRAQPVHLSDGRPLESPSRNVRSITESLGCTPCVNHGWPFCGDGRSLVRRPRTVVV